MSARLIKVRTQLEGISNDVSFVIGYDPTLGSFAREKSHFWNSTAWSQGFPVGTTYLSSWTRTPGRANDRAGALTVRCSVHTGVMNDDGERLLHAADNKLPLLNTFFVRPIAEYRTRSNQQTLGRGSLGSITYLHDKLIGALSATSQCGDHQRSGTNPTTTSWSPTFASWAGLRRIVGQKQAGENGLLMYNG